VLPDGKDRRGGKQQGDKDNYDRSLGDHQLWFKDSIG
jgi:hypothetical protein